MRRGADLLSHRLMWLLVASSALCFAAGVEWDYTGDNGPSHWAELKPDGEWQACAATSKSQSPINIDQDEATHKDIGNLQLSGYDNETSGNTLENNGHTVQLSVASGAGMTVTGGELPGTYKLVQIHFHWGSDDSKGSEHTVDGKAYPLEIHFVHYNESLAGVPAALGHSDGLAVLGVFAQIGDKANEGLNKLLEKFSKIKHKEMFVTVDQFAVKSILPSNTNDFARYSGSLTTPPCSEVVVWTVFKEPITITSEQMAKFRELSKNKQNEEEAKLVDNFRPTLQLNNRTVYVSYKVSNSAETINNGHLRRVSVAGGAAMLVWALLAHY